MAYTNLSPCTACGMPISKSAKLCPHCYTQDPLANCSVCRRPIEKRNVDAMVLRDFQQGSDEHPYMRVYHKKCFADILIPSPPPKCPDCGHSIFAGDTTKWEGLLTGCHERFPLSCTNCGRPDPLKLDYCHNCGLPIYRIMHKVRTGKWSGPWGWGDGTLHYHSDCCLDDSGEKKVLEYEQEKATEEQQKAKASQEEQIASMGQRGCLSMLVRFVIFGICAYMVLQLLDPH